MSDVDYSMPADIKPIDLAKFLAEGADEEACKAVAEGLQKYGILILKDPRVSEPENQEFLDMMEDYYAQPTEKKMHDTRPELHYQVGATPENTEKARNHCKMVEEDIEDPNKPTTLCPPGVDPKWRFFWRAGERDASSSEEYADLNSDQVVPAEFPQWRGVMDNWGGKMMGCVRTVTEMFSVHHGLEKDAITKLMIDAPHLLAPTGSDLTKYSDIGTVFASFHYDLNFMTIHGKSRYPGLFAWLRDGRKFKVSVPDGCLLVQAAKQFEMLTGGAVLAGFHEVVVTEDTHRAMEKRTAAGRPLWRVSSTTFSHINSAKSLKPFGPFATEEALAKYQDIKAGDMVRQELEAIALKASH